MIERGERRDARAEPSASRRRVRRCDDRGSGTALVLAVLGVVVLVVAWLGLLLGAQSARGRAQTAADLAALAGAERALLGSDDGCAVAREVVRRNGATVRTCLTEGAEVTVTTRVGSVGGEATATARAGPRRPLGG